MASDDAARAPQARTVPTAAQAPVLDTLAARIDHLAARRDADDPVTCVRGEPVDRT